MQSDPSGRGSVQSVKADSSRNGTQHGSTGPHEASGHAHGEADRASPEVGKGFCDADPSLALMAARQPSDPTDLSPRAPKATVTLGRQVTKDCNMIVKTAPRLGRISR